MANDNARARVTRPTMFEYRLITSNVIIIQDVGPWERYMSVTNDAEGVVRRIREDIAQMGPVEMEKGYRIFCIDSGGSMDELLHDGFGNFEGFKLLMASDPLPPVMAAIAGDLRERMDAAFERSEG